jgi:hypothetical protein
MNPRYLAYCRAHGRTPEQQHAIDEVDWPGGVMAGFIIWSNKQLTEARHDHPDWFLFGCLVNHEAYDNWLNERFK